MRRARRREAVEPSGYTGHGPRKQLSWDQVTVRPVPVTPAFRGLGSRSATSRASPSRTFSQTGRDSRYRYASVLDPAFERFPIAFGPVVGYRATHRPGKPMRFPLLLAIAVPPALAFAAEQSSHPTPPEVRIIDPHRELSDADFERLRDRLKGKPRAVAARSLGMPSRSSHWHGSDFWYFSTGRGILLVEVYDGKVDQMAYQKP
jgi:hypothetical protein